jgi:CRP/FNR family transcriptional regulator
MKIDYSSEQLRTFMMSGKLYYFPKHKVIQSTDLGLVLGLIKSGYVQRYLITPNGAESNQGIYGPGDFFPLTLAQSILLNQYIYIGIETYLYKTMTNAQIYYVYNDAFINFVKKNPIIYRALLIEAGERLRVSIQRVENMSLGNSYLRLAHQLVFYARIFGIEIPQGIKIILPLTHLNLSEILNISRETVSLAMIQLKNKGLIIKQGRSIIVPDIDKLESEFAR